MVRIVMVFTVMLGMGMAYGAGGKKSPAVASLADTAGNTGSFRDTTIMVPVQSLNDTPSAVASDVPVTEVQKTVPSRVETSRDTILVLTPRVDEDDAEERDDEEEDNDRDTVRRHGGAGGLTAELFRLDCTPLEKIAATEPDLKNKHFDFANETFMTFGMMAYGGPINGVRMGVSLNGGHKAIYSDKYETLTRDASVISANGGDSTLDSLAVLRLTIAYAGIIAEKQFEIDRLALYLGGMLGGGLVVVVKDFIPDVTSSAFTKKEHSPRDTAADDWTQRTAVAPVWSFDVHGGMAYSVARWLHIGVEGKLMWLFSNSGFGYGTGSFRTMNPGGRIRLMFGNAG